MLLGEARDIRSRKVITAVAQAHRAQRSLVIYNNNTIRLDRRRCLIDPSAKNSNTAIRHLGRSFTRIAVVVFRLFLHKKLSDAILTLRPDAKLDLAH